jgi:Family of unknown function (DUF5677)
MQIADRVNTVHDVATWLKFAEKLLQVGYALFNDREVPITERGAADPSVLVITLLARSISNVRGALVLVRAGLVVEARTLVRCVFENLFCIGGLVTERDAFAREMFHDELTSRKLRGKIILDRPMENKQFEDRLRSHIEQMNEKYPRTKFLTPKQASERSPLADAYLFYSQLSSDAAHPSMSALSRHMVRIVENNETVRGIDVAPKAKQEELADTVNMACHAFIGVLVGANQMLGGTSANDRINAIFAEYQVLAGIERPRSEN